MTNRINVKFVILLCLALLLAPFANALTVNDFFQNFYSLIENQYAFYTIMFLVTFIFLFAIFFALSKNIPFFKASGGAINPAGQIFALALSAIATLSFFSYVQRRGGAGYASGFFASSLRGPFGWIGWLLLALLILAVVFFAFRKGKGFGFGREGGEGGNLKGLTALLWVLSFILVMYGSISKNRTITTIGAVLFVIAVILTVLTGGFKFGEEKNEEEEEKKRRKKKEIEEGQGTIWGAIKNKANGQKIDGVKIECRDYSANLYQDSASNGDYEIVVPVGQYWLRATKEGYKEHITPDPIAVADQERKEYNFELEPISAEKGKISGKVVNLNDVREGVKADKVYLIQQPGDIKLKEVDCRDNGTFEITEIPLPSERLWVYAKKGNIGAYHSGPGGPLSLNFHNKEILNVVVKLNIPIQKGKIKGKIVDATNINNPVLITNSQVAVVKEENNRHIVLKQFTNTTNGEFEFNDIPFGSYTVYGRAADYVSVRDGSNVGKHTDQPGGNPREIITIANGIDRTDVVVPLKQRGPQTGKISGNVVNANTLEPIPNSMALLTDEENHVLQTKQSADGHFEFDAQFGKYYVTGEAENYEHGRNDYGGYPRGVIEVKSENPNQAHVVVPLRSRGAPPTPRGSAIFELIVGDRTLQGGIIEATDLIDRDRSNFKIKNSGRGGTLIWYASASKGLRISKVKGKLKTRQEDDVIVDVTDRTVNFIPHVTIFTTFGREKEEIEDVIRNMRAKAKIYYKVVEGIAQLQRTRMRTEAEMNEEARKEKRENELLSKIKEAIGSNPMLYKILNKNLRAITLKDIIKNKNLMGDLEVISKQKGAYFTSEDLKLLEKLKKLR